MKSEKIIGKFVWKRNDSGIDSGHFSFFRKVGLKAFVTLRENRVNNDGGLSSCLDEGRGKIRRMFNRGDTYGVFAQEIVTSSLWILEEN